MGRNVLLFALIITTPVFAQSPKEPWMLTLEERIALRTNPELARERVRRANRAQTTFINPEVLSNVDEFDGKTHPELFLPHEIFRTIVALAFTSSPRGCQLFRKGLMPQVKRLGLPRDFWHRLESISAIYIADWWALSDLGANVRTQTGPTLERTKEALELKYQDECRSRADAIAAARNEFGRERFDRFMYEVIAVHKFHSETEIPTAELLRWTENGCQ